MASTARFRQKKTPAEAKNASLRTIDLLRNEHYYQCIAHENGMTLRVSIIWVGNSGRFILHWIFETAKTKRRLMEYWPSSGKCLCSKSSRSWIVLSADEAIQIAAKISVGG